MLAYTLLQRYQLALELYDRLQLVDNHSPEYMQVGHIYYQCQQEILRRGGVSEEIALRLIYSVADYQKAIIEPDVEIDHLEK
jgi:hypothetical protein